MLTSRRPHRHFYINGNLEFSLFFDPTPLPVETIVKNFMEDRVFKTSRFSKKKLKSFEVSADGTEFHLELN